MKAAIAKSASPRVRARNRQGRCFELSLKGQLLDPSWTLVHGSIFGWIGHAWLIKDGTVYDPVLDQYLTQIENGQMREAVVERTYQLKEAAGLCASAGHYGPWHATSATVQGRLE